LLPFIPVPETLDKVAGLLGFLEEKVRQKGDFLFF
jgi:hypothetical protein